MKTIKARVHRLPTKKSNISLGNSGKGLIYHYGQPTPDYIMRTYQHLYITTDEEIKEGDCIINIKPWSMKITKATKMIEISEKQNKDEGWESVARKIIATTDPKLTKTTSFKDEKGFDGYEMRRFPEIPKSFIEEYCKAGGIDEVLVEYIGVTGFCNCKELGFLEIGHSIDCDTRTPQYYIPNLKDNTIIIPPVEEKMYSREEVEKLIHKAIMDYSTGRYSSSSMKWIEENL